MVPSSDRKAGGVVVVADADAAAASGAVLGKLQFLRYFGTYFGTYIPMS